MADEVKIDMDSGPGSQKAMSKFLADKKVVEDTIEGLNRDTRKLEELQERSALAVDGNEEAVVSKELKRLIKRVNHSTKHAQKILQAMAAENKKIKKKRKAAKREGGDDWVDEYGHVLRIREQTFNALTRKMVEAVRHHQMVKFESAEKAKEKCLRRAKMVWPDKTDEELAANIGDNPTGMFQQGIKTIANNKMKRAYEEANDRAKDVERLQRSIQELFMLFQDLAILVNKQGEVLNSIETNVNTASKNVKKGNAQLVKAHKYQKKTRKCMCCLLIIGIGILLAMVVSTGIIVGA